MPKPPKVKAPKRTSSPVAGSNVRLPELRALIKENDQRLYDFCFYMLYGGGILDDLILSIFREFGDRYRKMSRSKDSTWEHHEVRILLFQIAWETVREALTTLQGAIQFSLTTPGRDTRSSRHFDDDILKVWHAGAKELTELEVPALERLARIDADFRAPIVLRDILGFGDEEVMRILGIRWGVYRHRLHRGRLEYKDALRGRPVLREVRGTSQPEPV